MEPVQCARGISVSVLWPVQVQEWLKKLGTVSEIMEQWFQVQNVWTYMEAVFSGGDIVKQLPTEAKRFQNIDKNFMKIVQMAAETGNIVDVCNNIELIKTMLPHLQVSFCSCTKICYTRNQNWSCSEPNQNREPAAR